MLTDIRQLRGRYNRPSGAKAPQMGSQVNSCTTAVMKLGSKRKSACSRMQSYREGCASPLANITDLTLGYIRTPFQLLRITEDVFKSFRTESITK